MLVVRRPHLSFFMRGGSGATAFIYGIRGTQKVILEIQVWSDVSQVTSLREERPRERVQGRIGGLIRRKV